eukprot:9941297-Karenia_brevis.AAC.1
MENADGMNKLLNGLANENADGMNTFVLRKASETPPETMRQIVATSKLVRFASTDAERFQHIRELGKWQPCNIST